VDVHDHHLFRQATVTVRLLSAPPVADDELVSLLGHYERAASIGSPTPSSPRTS